jgi:hypothetical protein
MNERSDMDRVLSQWFENGPSTMPDRVVDVVADRIARQRQRPVWRLHWRPFDMNASIKIAAAIAAVVVLAVVGWNLLPGRSTGVGDGGSATPSLTSSPTPSATPSPTTSPTPAAARMDLQGDAASWTATVPAGWTGAGTWFLTSSQGPSGPTGIAVAATGAVNVPSDPCDGVGKVSDAASPADVVAALEARQDLVVSNAIDATLGGYSGKRVDVEVPADLSACDGNYTIFAEPDGSGFYAQGPSNLLRVWIVDVEGRPIVFWIQSFAGTPANDVADAQQIVDSIVITP